MEPSLGQSVIITAIGRRKKLKEIEEFSPAVMLIKKSNTNITLLANINLIAFGRSRDKIFGTLNRRDKFLVDSTWSPSQSLINPATSYRLNGNELTLQLYWGCEGGTNTDIERTFKKKE